MRRASWAMQWGISNGGLKAGTNWASLSGEPGIDEVPEPGVVGVQLLDWAAVQCRLLLALPKRLISMRICEENYSGCPVPGNRRFKKNGDS
jgi:hypothetical protein